MRTKITAISISLLIIGGGFIASSLFNSSDIESSYKARTTIQKDENYKGALAHKKMLYGDENGDINMNAIRNAYESHLEKRTSRASSLGLSWQSLGPNNVGGRTLALIIDNVDGEILVAGTTSGSVYRSTNGGNEWTPIDNFGTAFIGCATQATNGDMYMGTGESEGPGNGIYKSTDRGLTWSHLAATATTDLIGRNDIWSYVVKITTDPSNPSKIFAATHLGLYISSDAGVTWAKPIFSPPAVNGTGCEDMTWSGDGARLFVAFGGNSVVYSDNPSDGSSYKITTVDSDLNSSSQRLATSAADPSIVYLAKSGGTVGFGNFGGVWKSIDKGETFKPIDPAPPVTSPSWDIAGSDRDGTGVMWYAFAMGVDPGDADKMIIGSLQNWRYDGNWTRITHENGGVGANFSRQYIHADKQGVFWDPNNSNIVYITHDGGISKSVDGGVQWFEVVRDYTTSQFYGIGFDKSFRVIGGTQDNGNIGLDPTGEFSFGNPDFGIQISNQGILNGDGFDVEVSNLVDLKFTAAQNGNLGRSRVSSETGSGICTGTNANYCDAGPFNSNHRLWESADDPFSQDSVEFNTNTYRQTIAAGSGSDKTFKGTLQHVQVAADIDYGSAFFSVGSMVLKDSTGSGNLTGDGTGTVNLSTGEFTINWISAPLLNTPIYSYFDVSYEAGDVILLKSFTDEIPFYYKMKQPLASNMTLMVRDPVQSTLVMAINGGIIFARSVLDIAEDIEWFEITKNVPNFNSGWDANQTPTCFEFSDNGDHLYVGTNFGDVWRISKLSLLYRKNIENKGQVAQSLLNNLLEITKIYNGSRSVSGISLSPHDNEVLVVTHPGWIGSSAGNTWTYLIDNAQSTAGTSTTNVIDIRGDLPPMPVFDAEIDVLDPSTVLLGTAFGVWATTNVFAAGGAVEWTDESSSFGNAVPVYDIRQQRLSGSEALNHQMYYIGTHGNGIWASSTLVSTDEIDGDDFTDENYSQLNLYPNPVVDNAILEINLGKAVIISLKIVSINGQVVKSIPATQLVKGINKIELSTGNYAPGVYMLMSEINGEAKIAKFIKQ